jgi:hypothetical protein
MDALTLAQLESALRQYPKFQKHSVSFLNKIRRMQFLVSADDNGELCDIDGNPILMQSKKDQGGYDLGMYAMDKYGNLFVRWAEDSSDFVAKGIQTVSKIDGSKNKYQMVDTKNFNHSSLLAGGDVLCAGNIHIGWSVANDQETPGALSAIDNISGHYAPNVDALRECVRILHEEEGIALNYVRVGVMEAGAQAIKFYWGQNFLRGQKQPDWVSGSNAPHRLAPPIEEMG